MPTTLANLSPASVKSLIGALHSFGFQLHGVHPDSTHPSIAETINELEDAMRRADRKLVPLVTVVVPYSPEEIRFVLDEAYEAMRITCINLKTFIPAHKAVANRLARAAAEENQ